MFDFLNYLNNDRQPKKDKIDYLLGMKTIAEFLHQVDLLLFENIDSFGLNS